MGYRELIKIYYESIDAYRAMYESRYSSPDTVKLSFKIKDNQAFFIQNSEMAEVAFKILKADKNICVLCGELPRIAIDQFKRRCLIDEIMITNKIEGVYSTRREIASILSELETTVKEKRKKRRFWGLVEQYLKLLSNERISLQTCEEIRELYDELVLAEVIEEDSSNAPDGELFRKDSTSVYNASEKEIHRGSYPEAVIRKEMEKALALLNNEEVFYIYRIAAFHYLFGYIHPFYDGNGRLGRFIVSAMLIKELHPLLSSRISYTIAENIRDYYDAFETCNEPRNLGDVTPFVIMMLNMIKTSIEQLEEALKKRHTSLNYYTESISKLPGGSNGRTRKMYSFLIQAGLFSESGVSTRVLEYNMKNSYTTVKKELDFISSNSLLIRTRVGKENLYMIDIEKLDKYLREITVM